jgi:hypothetical protein
MQNNDINEQVLKLNLKIKLMIKYDLLQVKQMKWCLANQPKRLLL